MGEEGKQRQLGKKKVCKALGWHVWGLRGGKAKSLGRIGRGALKGGQEPGPRGLRTMGWSQSLSQKQWEVIERKLTETPKKV